MNTNIINWMKATRSLLPYDLGDALDVGSLNINGSAREVYIQFKSYTGIDMQEGKDVDIVANAHNLVFLDKDIFDTIVCMNTLEHDNRFWLTLKGINKVLKTGGHLIFCVPTFNFPIHNHPKDYWRMGEQVIREVVFEGYEVLDLTEVMTKKDNGKPINPIICAIGRKL